ncbi:MAG: S41 family peptidase [Bacteroidota bacterium]
MKMQREKIKIYGPIILAIVLIIGIILGNVLSKSISSKQPTGTTEQGKLSKITNYIERNYVDTVNTDILVESAIPAMLKELDPHSVYIPAGKMQQASDPLEGNFDGIGIQFNMQKDTIIVIDAISGGPSEMVGIQPGDRIIEVNDSTVAGVDMPSSDIVSMLKGERGTKVDVKVKRQGEPNLLDFTITRDKIPYNSVDVAYMINENIGYIKISRFAKTTKKEFLEGLEKLKEKGLKKLIIDVRTNNGGYLNAATEIIDQFLKKGKLIVYTEGKNSPKQEIRATREGMAHDLDVAVMIDEWSASASEIMAGAIQDNDRGTIVGRRSFGKGLVQEQTKLSDGSAIRLTVARYYTPTGRSIQKPYEKGRQDYAKDIQERYEQGEFFHVDSIDFADSLKYNTPEGDTVYGGGGIMPDYFIPADTTNNSKFMNKVTNKGLIYEFAFNYADQHRKKLEHFETPEEIDKYLETEDIYTQFLNYVHNHNISKDIEGDVKSKKTINTRVKAYIARNILNNEGYYPIIKNIDNTLQKTISIMEDNDLQK